MDGPGGIFIVVVAASIALRHDELQSRTTC